MCHDFRQCWEAYMQDGDVIIIVTKPCMALFISWERDRFGHLQNINLLPTQCSGSKTAYKSQIEGNCMILTKSLQQKANFLRLYLYTGKPCHEKPVTTIHQENVKWYAYATRLFHEKTLTTKYMYHYATRLILCQCN